MSPLHAWSKVCMAPLHARSKVWITPINVQSKFADFAPQMEGSNADFAPHMEGSHEDFAPHMDRRHSFRDQQIAKIAKSANFFLSFFSFKPHISYMIYVTTLNDSNILRENTFKLYSCSIYFSADFVNCSCENI